MPTLICGSVAYDTIMVFQDRFKNHILPDQIHILNVSFLVPAMRRDDGFDQFKFFGQRGAWHQMGLLAVNLSRHVVQE